MTYYYYGYNTFFEQKFVNNYKYLFINEEKKKRKNLKQTFK